MKITKRQLRRIIKEEKAKLLRESITDMSDYENLILKVSTQLTDNFGEDMMKLYDEEPAAFTRPVPGTERVERTSKMDWEEQVVYAQQELESALEAAIVQAIQSIETQLHDGQYYDSRGR